MSAIIHLRMWVCGVGAAIAITVVLQDAATTLPKSEGVSVWCRCGNCRHMPSAAEQLCCKMQPRHCLSRRAEMEMLDLDEGVLAVTDQHRVDMLVGEVRLNNEGRRHVAYRQFVLWRHGRLGQGNRRVIPSCCVWAICDRYPSVDGHYRGYVYASFFILAISSMLLCIFELTTGEIRNYATVTQIKAYWLLPSGVNRFEHPELNYINFTPMIRGNVYKYNERPLQWTPRFTI